MGSPKVDMFKKVSLGIILILLIFFFTKDHFAKLYLEKYLQSRFDGSIVLEKVNISPWSITVGGLKIKSKFSLSVEQARLRFDILKRGLEFVKSIAISNFDAGFNGINFNLDVKRISKDTHRIEITRLKIKDKKIDDIYILFFLKGSSLGFNLPNRQFLNPFGEIKGRIDPKNPKAICIMADLDRIPFGNISTLIAEDKSFLLEGLFSGKCRVCFDDLKLSSIEASLQSPNGGIINIEQGGPAEFLKDYLDKPSYEVVIDSFRHYTYNEGEAKVYTENKDVIADIDFSSQKQGSRVLTIHFHNIIGGGDR